MWLRPTVAILAQGLITSFVTMAWLMLEGEFHVVGRLFTNTQQVINFRPPNSKDGEGSLTIPLVIYPNDRAQKTSSRKNDNFNRRGRVWKFTYYTGKINRNSENYFRTFGFVVEVFHKYPDTDLRKLGQVFINLTDDDDSIQHSANMEIGELGCLGERKGRFFFKMTAFSDKDLMDSMVDKDLISDFSLENLVTEFLDCNS